MMESRLKKVCPACGTTSISNAKMRKRKCYVCKTVFEVPILREIGYNNRGVKFRMKVKE